ncbi:disease resistance protein RLM3-like [Jatropha curcas]|uniref:disease resistance protein RLM3-like n=1 Tax=Jatropha curcas TaxID=180498 RepID=UPI0018930FAA|nr:disease resistance protein RLM3-like [Jatropha curcas]
MVARQGRTVRACSGPNEPLAQQTDCPSSKQFKNHVFTIQESCISIVIFSKNYADSPWCLDELVVINECREKSGQIVLPVFYRVDPTDVQELRGPFARALARLLKDHSDSSHNLGGWCHALKTISNDLSAFVSNEIKDDQMLVQRIVNRLSEILSHMPSNASYHDKLVGIDRSAGK